METGIVPLLVAVMVVVLVVAIFIRISAKIRRGGGSLTTTVLGATDDFLTLEKRKAAETIVNENAGKRFETLPSADPKERQSARKE
jgi:hypothetical protein